MDFDIVQILMLATVNILGNPIIIHVGHDGSLTITWWVKTQAGPRPKPSCVREMGFGGMRR
jgi:hypothetical protein